MSLASVGGFLNAGGLIVVGVVVSHVTGHVTNFGRDVGMAKWELAARTGAWLASFLAGSMFSTFLIESNRTERLRSIDVRPLLVVGLFVGLFAIFGSRVSAISPNWQAAVAGWMCFAMGLQNAMISRLTGGQVRGTHMTGVVTDLGIELVRLLFHVRERLHVVRFEQGGRLPLGVAVREVRSAAAGEPSQRVRLLGAMLGSFFVGAILGTLAFLRWDSLGALPAVAAIALLGTRELIELRREIAREKREASLVRPEPGRGDDPPAPSKVAASSDTPTAAL